MISSRRVAIALSSLVVGTMLWAPGCGGGGGLTGDTNALVEVETSPIYLTIENKAGKPLLDVHVAIVPVGGVTQFTTSVGRMETAEKRNLSIGDFRGRDGTPLDLRVSKPKTVRVTAKDLDGNVIESAKPWK
jgi:hypothetical protein